MRYFLFVLLFLFSTQSFADLEGKALSCTFKNSDGRVFHNAYFFEKSSEVTYYRLEREKDRLKYKHQLTFKYEVDRMSNGIAHSNFCTHVISQSKIHFNYILKF